MPIFGHHGGGYRTHRYGGRGHGFRFSPRLIVGAVIALAGIISYFAKTQINPVTGEKQRVALTASEEIALGARAAPQMAGQMGGTYPESEPRAAVVARVGRQLVDSSPEIRRSPYVQHFRFHLLKDDRTVNAFALPGGRIFITAALYDRLENEAQLAGVLGHEIGHVIHRHGAEHMAKGQLGQAIVTGVAIGTSDQESGRFATLATAMANQMLQLKYSRSDELESDSAGLVYMAQAGYDPSEMRKVMEILKAASRRGGGANIFATHPDPNARVQKIEEFLQKHYASGIPPNLTKGAPLRGGGPIDTNVER